MRVAVLTSAHPRNDIRIFEKEALSLLKSGFEVSLIVADGLGDEIKNGVQIIDAGCQSKGRLGRMTLTVTGVYKKAVGINADIFHLHDPELLPLVPKLLKHGNVIYDAHEDLPRQIMGKHWIPKALRKLISFFSERVENHYARKTSGIVAATPFIAERFRKINSNVVNINNYPMLEEFARVERKPSDERLACYVGGISSARGIFEMVKAMEFIDGKLLLAGLFANPADREQAQNLPGWEKVVELGFCGRERVMEILAAARAGLVLFHPDPNHTNAQPNKLFEYMAAGLPVIASDFLLWREIIDSAKCGVCVNPLKPKEIADAVEWVFNNPEEAEKMGAAGKKAVEEKYNWRAEDNKLVKFYQEMVKHENF